MPAEGHGLGPRSGREPQREDADQDAPEVREEMSCVRHDGQTVGGVSTWRGTQDFRRLLDVVRVTVQD